MVCPSSYEPWTYLSHDNVNCRRQKRGRPLALSAVKQIVAILSLTVIRGDALLVDVISVVISIGGSS